MQGCLRAAVPLAEMSDFGEKPRESTAQPPAPRLPLGSPLANPNRDRSIGDAATWSTGELSGAGAGEKDGVDLCGTRRRAREAHLVRVRHPVRSRGLGISCGAGCPSATRPPEMEVLSLFQSIFYQGMRWKSRYVL